MKKKLPNIILIVMDTVGAKHMSLYGYHRKTTPNLERIAEECTVYNRCFAPSCWTIPSHASMFTGLYPSQHGAHEGNFALSPNIQHLVPVLKQLGYRTYGISSNGLVSPASGLCPGFDYFKDFSEGYIRSRDKIFGVSRESSNRELSDLSKRLSHKFTLKDKIEICVNYFNDTGEIIPIVNKFSIGLNNRINKLFGLIPTEKSSKFTLKSLKLFNKIINSHNDTPFFLLINIMEAHTKYNPPISYRYFSSKLDKQTIPPNILYQTSNLSSIEELLIVYNNLYDDELLFLDSILSRIWQSYKQSSISDNTIFIITSDHGEHFGEKFCFCHSLSLYNEVLWVPLIIHFPKAMATSVIEDRLVSLTDLYSTIFDLVESPLPRPVTSLSLLSNSKKDQSISQLIYPEIWETELKGKGNFFRQNGAKFSPPVSTVIFETGLKIIENRDGNLQIYDLNTDANENKNLTLNLSPETLTNIYNIMGDIKKEIGLS